MCLNPVQRPYGERETDGEKSESAGVSVHVNIEGSLFQSIHHSAMRIEFTPLPASLQVPAANI